MNSANLNPKIIKHVKSLGLWFIVLQSTIFFCAIVYFKAVYRIEVTSFTLYFLSRILILWLKSIKEIKDMLSTYFKPKYNDRCRIVNSTHFICLPNVFLIGASKCGTTSIASYLFQHPKVAFVRRRKNAHRHREIHRSSFFVLCFQRNYQF